MRATTGGVCGASSVIALSLGHEGGGSYGGLKQWRVYWEISITELFPQSSLLQPHSDTPAAWSRRSLGLSDFNLHVQHQIKILNLKL